MKTQQFIDVKPSSRILRVLGDIDFQPWQCLAELIDNSFDDFQEIKRSGVKWPDGYQVSITLPRNGELNSESVITVRDTGRGMDLDTLKNSVRAGFSSNDRFSKLGLFGMGFNIATARLGAKTRVLTTRSQDQEWIGVELALNEIKDDFQAPVFTQNKDAQSHHGTIVEISHLDVGRCAWISRNAAQIRSTLGDLYSFVLSTESFEIYINGVRVMPRKPCIWDSGRSITFGKGSTAEVIPAVIFLDEVLPEANACLSCGNYQVPGEPICLQCGSSSIIPKERRIKGWLGIQRYLAKSDFGISFLRNGRKILRHDKRLFDWTDPNDPLAAQDLEYPVELGQGGRIVGEIHLDHVPVNYQKNAFEWSDKHWLSAVRYLRGEGPLLPKKAKLRGYPPNESPLGRLHRAFRRNDPGYRCLIPGNGEGPIHATCVEWAEKFYSNDPEYLSDEKWWAAVEYHENKVSGHSGTAESDGSGVLEELGLDGPLDIPGDVEPQTSPTPSPQPAESEQEKIARYIRNSIKIPELSREYGIVEFGASIDVEVFQSANLEIRDANGFRTPVWLVRGHRKSYNAFIDLSHRIYAEFAEPNFNYLIVEIANHLRVRAQSMMPLSQAVASIKTNQLADLKIDAGILSAQARELLAVIRERMVDLISPNPDRAWQFLSADERSATETKAVLSGELSNIVTLTNSGEFVVYSPHLFTARLVQEWPEAFMDAQLFKGPYSQITTATGRHASLGRVVSYLYDVALLADALINTPDQLARCRFSLQLLRLELAPNTSEV